MKSQTITIILLALLIATFAVALSCGDDDDDDNDDNDDDDAETVDVPADNSEGVMTGLSVVKGQDISLTATGYVQLEVDGEDVGPDGLDQACGAGCPLEDSNWGMLLIKIESSAKAGPVYVGAGSDFSGQAPAAGDLGFTINDSDYSDNGGSFSVDVDLGDEPSGDDDDDDATTCTVEEYCDFYIACGAYADQDSCLSTSQAYFDQCPSVDVFLGCSCGCFEQFSDCMDTALNDCVIDCFVTECDPQ